MTTGWQRFERTAMRRGAAPAIIQGGVAVSFTALHAMALRQAQALQARGVRAGDRVVVFAENAPEVAAAIAAIWRLGALPVIVSTAGPPSHLAAALELTGARHAVCSAAPPIPVDVFIPDSCSDRPATALPPLTTDSEAPASVLFTSGSTGQPKGVVQSHATLTSCCGTLFDLFGLKPDDRLLCGVPWSHDYGWGQLHFTLFGGLGMVLPEVPGVIGLCAAIARHRPTVFAGVPSLFAALLFGVSAIRGTDTSPLRLITSTGSAMPLAVIEALRETFPNAALRLNYGLTETYRSASLPPHLLRDRPAAAGKAVPGVELRIVRPDGTPASLGEAGEVVHCGAGVFSHYYGNPEATARTRRPDPFNPGGFRVHTGDLGRLDADGILYLSGRIDRQIKSMGVRVSPDEVESLLFGSGVVAAVAVSSIPHDIMGEMVVCAYVPCQDEDSLVTLKAHARKVLSQPMLPRLFMRIDTMPRTGGGKTDHGAVRAMFLRQGQTP